MQKNEHIVTNQAISPLTSVENVICDFGFDIMQELFILINFIKNIIQWDFHRNQVNNFTGIHLSPDRDKLEYWGRFYCI